MRASSNFVPDSTPAWWDEAIRRADSGDEKFFSDLLIFAAIMVPSAFRGIEFLDSTVLAKAPFRFELAKVALMFIEELSRGRVTSSRVDSRRLAVIQRSAIAILIENLFRHEAAFSIRARRGNSDVFLAREGSRVFVNYIVDTQEVPGAESINRHFLPSGIQQKSFDSWGRGGTILAGFEETSMDQVLDREHSIAWSFNHMTFGHEKTGLVDLAISFETGPHLNLFSEMLENFSKPLHMKLRIARGPLAESIEF